MATLVKTMTANKSHQRKSGKNSRVKQWRQPPNLMDQRNRPPRGTTRTRTKTHTGSMGHQDSHFNALMSRQQAVWLRASYKCNKTSNHCFNLSTLSTTWNTIQGDIKTSTSTTTCQPGRPAETTASKTTFHMKRTEQP